MEEVISFDLNTNVFSYVARNINNLMVTSLMIFIGEQNFLILRENSLNKV